MSAEHGYRWDFEPLAKRANKNDAQKTVIRDNAPVLVVEDVAKFEAFRPGAVLKSLDGTSIRVLSQNVGRRLIVADRAVKNEKIQEAILAALAGLRTRGASAPKFIGIDGTQYGSKNEMDAANLARLVDNGISVEQAKAILSL